MFWIDLGLLGMTAYRMVGALKAAFTVLEKLALAFLFALGLKSLVLFFLIQVRVQPLASIQLGMTLLVLVLTRFLTAPETQTVTHTPSARTQWQTVFAGILIAVLVLFSLLNAWFFPITESDATWYQVRGMSFFHEVKFDSDWVVPQLGQYPPFIPLLFSWFIAFGMEPLRIIFPLFYLALNIIFYCRVHDASNNSKMAAMLTLVLATTPYLWWHGVLPFLDLCTAVFYSTGALYWFFWVKSLGADEKRSRTLAFLSGLFFGLSAWTRLEFLLYLLIPIGLTLCAESFLGKKGERDLKSFLLFFLPLLFFPTIWFLNLMFFVGPLLGRVKMVGAVGVMAWMAVLVFMMGNWKLKLASLIKVGALAGGLYIIYIFVDNSGDVSGWKKLSIALYRSLTVHGFYLFTGFLAVFVFFERLKDVATLNKLFALFLVLYPLVHFAIFSYSPPKWNSLGAYISATFTQPGNSVNLSDTRGVMSMYPLLLFYVASIPFFRRGFKDV